MCARAFVYVCARVRAKFLGVMIDSKLNWKDHIAMFESKLSKTIAIMHKANHLLDRRSGMIL